MSDSSRPRGRQPTRLLRPSMGFSRQECWSGVPSPSPVCQATVPRLSELPSQCSGSFSLPPPGHCGWSHPLSSAWAALHCLFTIIKLLIFILKYFQIYRTVAKMALKIPIYLSPTQIFQVITFSIFLSLSLFIYNLFYVPICLFFPERFQNKLCTCAILPLKAIVRA